MAYSDTKGVSKDSQTTSLFGAGFALTGVVISSVYTVWIGSYHRKLEMNSQQLLHSQSIVGAVMLGVVGIISGKIPVFSEFNTRMYWSVFMVSCREFS